jgi:peptidoglycan/LPS O-acetylase OafA/YrhL
MVTFAPPRPVAVDDGVEAVRWMPYLPGIDGLRAIAVLAVLLFHAELPWIPGGFLGVDAFFVISGYLITALLWTEYTATGTVAYRRFLVRRARRLLPALAAFLAGASLIAVLFARDVLGELLREIPAAATYVYNWFAIATEQSYFESFARPSFFQHLWSLAIEEQFYIIWPLLALLGLRFLPRRRLLLLVAGGAIASTLLMAALYAPGVDPARLYYGTDTRFAGLLVGAALALAWHPARARIGMNRFLIRAKATDALGVVGLAILGWAFLTLRGDALGASQLYRGGFLLASLGTALVVAATAHPRTRLGRLLGTPTLRYLGRRSYGIYLWHWPVYMVTRARIDVGFDGIELFTFRLVATLVLAELSYRLVERPVRRGIFLAGIRQWAAAPLRPPWPTRAATAVAALAVLAFAVATAHTSWQATVAAAAVAPTTTTEGADVEAAISSPVIEFLAIPSPLPTDAEPATAEDPGSREVLGSGPAQGSDAASATSAADPEADAPDEGEPPPASADTGGQAPVAAPEELDPVERGTTTTPPVEPGPRGFVAVGDSVMLGASASLDAIGAVKVDAEVSRPWDAAPAVTAALRDQGVVDDVLVIHLGTNGPVTAAVFDELMADVSDVGRVIVVNVRVPRRWESEVNAVIADGVTRWPNAELLDWHGFSNDRPALFAADGVHLTEAGMAAYASLVENAVNG